MTKLIGEQTIRDFQQNGAVLIPGLLTDWVKLLQQGIEKNITEPGEFVRDYPGENSGRFFGDYCNWQRIEEYREFLFESPAADMAMQLMGSKKARLFHEHVLVKEPNTAIPTPWHHDQPYYCVNGKQNCSLWLALDPVPKETSVEFVSGSHRWGKWFRPERFDRSPLYQNDPLESLPDIEANRSQYKILSWDVKPGDVIAFHYLTLHGAPGNQSVDTRRRAFSSRWVGEDATFALRQGKTSPPFPNTELKHGEPLDGPEFPLVRG
jgi:ectoine hydroxylase-related dioxygenase (phytanoyl-CoA dioxygenase family)